MFGQIASTAEAAPIDWAKSTPHTECRLHQLAPYIGKLKPVIARQLLQKYTKKGDVVLDCFSGSGTIPLETVLLGRHAIAYDANPYAITLTRAKLHAPSDIEVAKDRLSKLLSRSESRPEIDLDSVPEWVRKFFHPNTLQKSLQFADQCIDQGDEFFMACLLSILHHQRPGFLSYPSSHLVPYLRDRKYPRSEYPEMYTERDLATRLFAKVQRTYKYFSETRTGKALIVEHKPVESIDLTTKVDAIVTSPPYMNALDYVRDNRLRMWFLDRSTQNYSPEPTERSDQSDAITDAFARNVLKNLRTGGHCVLIVGETVRRKRVTTHPAQRIYEKLAQQYPRIEVSQVIHDIIPDVRRSRREGAATKRELILVLRMG